MLGVFDILRIGIGPSSIRIVAPMRAAARFVDHLGSRHLFIHTSRIETTLSGVLAWGPLRHAADSGVILGLSSADPETVEPNQADLILADARERSLLALGGRRAMAFEQARDIVLDPRPGAGPAAGALSFVAYDEEARTLLRQDYHVFCGGGLGEEDEREGEPPYPFASAAALLALTRRHGMTIAGIVRANEIAIATDADLRGRLSRVRAAMDEAVERGLATGTELPEHISRLARHALAAGEENAAGGRIVAAPSNGASGILPAVMRHYRDVLPPNQDGEEALLLTAAAVGMLARPAAPAGCQGEIGVASAMAAAGLVAAMNGSDTQALAAAAQALTAHIGLACDPGGGIVRSPCIERNALGAARAVDAAERVLAGDGTKADLDAAIAALNAAAAGMRSMRKENSPGGLAVTIVEC